jgi:8-oxo-dGTP diphosphatase
MGNWEHRHRVIMAAFLVFRDKEKVLLLRRANTGYMDGYYSLPAGHVDGDEPAIVAACREAKEEVGVTIEPADLELVHTVHEKAEGHERLNLGFEVKAYKGKITNMEPEKCDELRWVPITDLPDDMVPSIRELLEHISAGRRYSDYNFS